MTRARMNSRPLIALLGVCACVEAPPCVTLPCPTPGVAIEITLTGSPMGTALTTASYRVSPNGSPVPCNQGSAANECVVNGGPGTYQLVISAMFYETVQRTIIVPSKSAGRCTCPSSDTQRLTIAMAPTS